MSRKYPLARRVGGSGLVAAIAVVASTGLASPSASASVPGPAGAVVSAYAWGANDSGQLGIGNANFTFPPVQISALANVQQVAEGQDFGAALLGDGTVYTWGSDGHGQLGDGQTGPITRLIPDRVPGLTGVKQIAAGYHHVLALKTDGTVWAWGFNGFRELGDGTTTDRPTPFQIPGLTGIQAVSASFYDSMALGTDGSVWAWGHNGFGELGDGTTTNRPPRSSFLACPG